MKIVIVGGVAGGATAAARLRRLDESAEIILIERDAEISYANCGLPYYIGGVIPERDNLLVQTAGGMRSRYKIDVRTNSEAISIDRSKKEIEVRDLKDNRAYRESYDHLLLATGAKALIPQLPGIDDDRVFRMKTLADADLIHSFIASKKPKQACVIGGGFIGIEMAESLAHRGIKVSLVEKLPQLLPPLDPEMASFISNHVAESGVELHLGAGIISFESGDKVRAKLDDGSSIDTDMAIISIGIKPESGLARAAGLKLNERGYIMVDQGMRTSDPAISCIGDAIAAINPITGTIWSVALAGPANRQARIAADSIAGRDSKYRGIFGVSIVKAFSMAAASVGMNEKTLKASNIRYEKSYTHSPSHASYYPGAAMISTKLIFDPENGKLFGAQIVGSGGVDKRIDVISSVIERGQGVIELGELELSYAPPFGSAKDPVNVAGSCAVNILNGDMKIIHADKIDDAIKDGAQLIDVRTPHEFSAGSIKDAINIPLDDLRTRIDELAKDRRTIVFCRVGLRGYLAARILMQSGFQDVVNLSGGYITYMAAGLI